MSLEQQISSGRLLFDGAMGTGIQQADVPAEDFGSHEGLNEWLCLSRPDLIRDLHLAYFDAGCDIVESNSFGAFPVVLEEFGLAKQSQEIAQAAARIAREAADSASTSKKPRWAAGSIGPGTRLPSLGQISYRSLLEAYLPMVRGLITGGVDLLLVETCQDPLQAKAAMQACEQVFSELQKRLPLGLQLTMESNGTMLLGTELPAALGALAGKKPSFLGLNCATGPDSMLSHVQYLGSNSPFPVSVQPNAGLPHTEGGRMVYDLEPEAFAEWQLRFAREFGVRILGGCCGTRPAHLAALHQKLESAKSTISYHGPSTYPETVSSLYHAANLSQEPGPLLIGERTNANGSRAFRRALETEDLDSQVEVAREQEAEGAHVLDVCVAAVGRDEGKDMHRLLSRLRSESTLPLMIDSTDPATIKNALELLGGRAIVNSINLEDGEGRARELLELCAEHGAALVALCIDEEGMARTAERKVAVARRIAKLAAEYGLRNQDLLVDPLTFTLASGDVESRHSARHTLDAIQMIKQELPGSRTVLGLSNISFGLKPALRRVLNSVFLEKAVSAGLDAAILHAGKILPAHQIDAERRSCSEALVAGDFSQGDPLAKLLELGGDKSEESSKQALERLPVEERLQQRIIQGNSLDLEKDLEEAMLERDPFKVISQLLLPGMKTVGELFGAGKLQLPFVLKSAETMKRAVSILEPAINTLSGGDWQNRGKLLLATVRGDVHDIGKNLVAILVQNNGYEVVDLGIKVHGDTLLKGIREHKPDAVGLSGLLVKSTLIMRENLEQFNAEDIKLPVLLGGAALNRRYVEKDLRAVYNGAVYYARDAFEGLNLLENLREGKLEPASPDPSPVSQVVVPEKPAVHLDAVDDKAPQEALPANMQAPTPPFWGSKVETWPLEELWPWLNLQSLVRGEWAFKRRSLSEQEWKHLQEKTVRPLLERMKRDSGPWLKPQSARGWFPVKAEGRRLWIWETPEAESPRWHLDLPRQTEAPWRCITDYLATSDSDAFNLLGVQWVTVGPEATREAQRQLEANRYSEYLYVHGFGVEVTEALAERVHRAMREDLKMEGEDSPDMHKRLRQGYRGSRYSFGYPACPHLEDQKILAEMLDVTRIGCSLTEEWQIVPEQSTSAIVIHHPEAKYFSVE